MIRCIWAFAVIVVGLSLQAGSALAGPDRQRIDGLTATEISALQQRLADAKCYSGPIDGRPTESTKAAVNACPDQRPQLRIETGMHVAPLSRIGVDAACHIAATASDDKTVRLWSLPDGKMLRTLRLAIGAGEGGKDFAAAVSPDGRYVAVGGYDAAYEVVSAMAVTIFDAPTGGLVAQIGGFESSINHLAFSPDGRWLAVAIGAGVGMRVIETASWRQVAADKAYQGSSQGVAFAPDGRLYSVSFDGKLRRYSPGPRFAREGVITTRGGKLPFSVAIDRANERIAVGFYDSPAVDMYDAHSMRFRLAADTVGIDKTLHAVAWASDGQTLIAGGNYQHDGHFPAVLFDREGRRLREQPLATDAFINLATCGSGFVAAATDPAFGLLSGDGRPLFWHESVSPDLRAKRGEAFTIAADAKRMRFGLDYGDKNPVVFDLASATLADSPGSQPDFASARVDGLPVTDWRNSMKPSFNGRPIPLDSNEVSMSLAIRPGGNGFILGSAFYLRALDARGTQIWQRPAPSAAWGVNISADGRIIVAAFADGTIRWYRWSDGRELLALFVNKQNRTWVAWMPSGFYTASPGGEDMIGWHVNRGWAQTADFFPASKFRDQFSRPDVVAKVLDTLDEGEALRQADAARGGKAAPTRPLLDQLPPVISILSPVDGASVGEDVQVEYLVRSPSNLPVDAIEPLVDGRPISASRGLARISANDALTRCLAETHGLGRAVGGLQGCRGSLTIHLPQGAGEIGLFSRSGDKTSDVVRVRLASETSSRGVTADGKAAPKPKLYALVVGISAYANPDYALTYPAKDAQDFATSLQNQKGGQYGDVVIRTLTDRQATASAIKDGLDWLTKQVTNRDVGLVYLAGHGMLDERDRFYFLAADSDAARLRATAVPRDDIADTLDALPGKALLFLDACHAGAVALGRREALNVNTVVNDLADAEHGVTVFAASTGRQLSQENQAWKNGAFTKAIVEGLGLPGTKAKADFIGSGIITTSELDAYVANRVKGLTSGGQSPVMIRPATVPDFPLAMAR